MTSYNCVMKRVWRKDCEGIQVTLYCCIIFSQVPFNYPGNPKQIFHMKPSGIMTGTPIRRVIVGLIVHDIKITLIFFQDMLLFTINILGLSKQVVIAPYLSHRLYYIGQFNISQCQLPIGKFTYMLCHFTILTYMSLYNNI